jgi:hypothetical protein
LLVSAAPSSDGKYCIIHVRETDGRNASLSLRNGIDGTAIDAVEVDVTGIPVSSPSLNISPLESKFYKLIIIP